jgi:hypothetical protein
MIELLGNVGHVESRFGPFRDSVGIGARYIHSLHQTYHILINRFGCTRWNSYVTWVMYNLVSVLFRDSVSFGA